MGRANPRLHQQVDPGVLSAMVLEAEQSFDAFEQLVEHEGLDCDYRRTGRFIGAHAPKAMDALRRRADMLDSQGGETARLVEKVDVGEELVTTRYSGGQRAGRRAFGSERLAGPALLFVRPEKLSLQTGDGGEIAGQNCIVGRVHRSAFLGNVIRTELDVGVSAVVTIDAANGPGACLLAPGTRASAVWSVGDSRLLAA